MRPAFETPSARQGINKDLAAQLKKCHYSLAFCSLNSVQERTNQIETCEKLDLVWSNQPDDHEWSPRRMLLRSVKMPRHLVINTQVLGRACLLLSHPQVHLSRASLARRLTDYSRSLKIT